MIYYGTNRTVRLLYTNVINYPGMPYLSQDLFSFILRPIKNAVPHGKQHPKQHHAGDPSWQFIKSVGPAWSEFSMVTQVEDTITCFSVMFN